LAVGAVDDSEAALLETDWRDETECGWTVKEEKDLVADVITGAVGDVAEVPEELAEGESGGSLTLDDVVDCESEDERLEMVVAWIGLDGRGDDATLKDLVRIRTEIGEVARERDGSALCLDC